MVVRTPAIALNGKLYPKAHLPNRIVRIQRSDDDNASTALERLAFFDPDFSTLRVEGVNHALTIDDELNHLQTGDIVRLNFERGEVWVMYRRHSPHNAMLLTERCNSWCIMCSQPPKPVQDDERVDEWLTAIPLMSSETPELAITGGEPLLLGDRFFRVIDACCQYMPTTALHILTNGRLFGEESLALRLKSYAHPDLMLGVPLYSDIAWRHDFVVQAEGAFDETIRGLINLASAGLPIELRVVIHQHTLPRLTDLARFIARNLPFVHHVALMGLEPIGFARSNLASLWIEPKDCVPAIQEAVSLLQQGSVSALIYNYPLCVLPEHLWPIAQKSISDWKNIYLPVCEPCEAKQFCPGFFHSATDAHSSQLKPVTDIELSQLKGCYHA